MAQNLGSAQTDMERLVMEQLKEQGLTDEKAVRQKEMDELLGHADQKEIEGRFKQLAKTKSLLFR
jgi:hypothetical protein